jgi:hypothetical protein
MTSLVKSSATAGESAVLALHTMAGGDSGGGVMVPAVPELLPDPLAPLLPEALLPEPLLPEPVPLLDDVPELDPPPPPSPPLGAEPELPQPKTSESVARHAALHNDRFDFIVFFPRGKDRGPGTTARIVVTDAL